MKSKLALLTLLQPVGDASALTEALAGIIYRRSVIVGVLSSSATANARVLPPVVVPPAIGFFTRDRMYLKNSYVDQQIAVAGIWYRTRACIPLKKPITPALLEELVRRELNRRVGYVHDELRRVRPVERPETLRPVHLGGTVQDRSHSYAPKYSACAGPAPATTAITPRNGRIKPSFLIMSRSVDVIVSWAFMCVSDCMRVFTESSGYMTQCSITPAIAPAVMMAATLDVGSCSYSSEFMTYTGCRYARHSTRPKQLIRNAAQPARACPGDNRLTPQHTTG
uniref:Uncharacterized protein n=1 Tax=Anopheles culicifacies TaxID=139723 RepID=A0A182M0P4_9DIPT